jgi:phage-related minor tail protein
VSVATAGVTVGSVWLDVLPSMRNFGSEIVNGTEQASRQAGQRAGDALGEGTESGFKGKIAAIAAVGTVIGAAVGVAVSAALDIQAGQAKLQAQLGLTAQDSERYGRVAGQLYSSAYGESLDSVNEAIAEVHRNIGANLNDADLSQITGTVLNLADTFGVELAGSTQAVGQLMKTGLAPNAQAALDVITRGFQLGVDRGGDFLDTLTEYSVQFDKFGLDAGTATGILVQGMQAGARNSDLVADAIKEFSIRAVDGSKLTAQGFQAVGLNATDMAARIAKGGPEASAALDLTIDRLRAMPDPVARSQAAVALFGTQAEDLGDALFAIDPSSAVSALGQVGGAADRMNQTLGDTAQANITSFMRTMQMAFVTVVGGYVIPAVTTLAGIIGPILGPALSLVAGVLTGAIVPAFQTFGQWVQNNASWITPLAVGIGVFVLALNAAAIATAAWGLATSIASGIVGVVRGAVMGFQVAMWLLNAAMAANPVGIIVAALVALVAGLVVAYNTSETFRNIVNGAWEAIKVGAQAAWDGIQAFFGWLGSAASTVGALFAAGWAIAVSAFTTARDAIVAGAQAIGTAATWLWETILSPVFSAIGLAIRILIAVVTTILVAPFVIAFNLIGMAAMALWTNWISPAWEYIKTGLATAATFIDTYVFAPIRLGLSLLGGLFSTASSASVSAFQGLQAGLAAVWAFIDATIFAAIRYALNILVIGFNYWRDQAIAAWQLVQAGLMIAWNLINTTIIQPLITILRVGLVVVFNFFRDAAIAAWTTVQNGLAAVWAFLQSSVFAPLNQYLIGPLVQGFNILRDGAIAAWNILRDGVAAVWNFLRDSVWNPLVNFVTQTIPNAFQTGADAVGRAWESIKAKVRDPIEAVVNVVYNQGIVKVWNWVAGLVGLGPLQEWHVPAFARGGAITGGTAGKDSVLAALMPGEYVLSKPAVDALGGAGAVDMLHRGLRPGADRRGAANLYRVLGIPGFAEGGPVTDAGSGNSLDSLWKAVTGGISSVTSMFSNTEWGRGAIGLVKKLADSLWPALLKKVTDYFASLIGIGGDVPAGSGPVVDEVRRAAAAFGWDSGAQWAALSWIISHESGWRPTAQNPTSTAYGLFQFLDSTWATVGGSKTSNPYQQAVYGLRYISSRYGSPTGAQAFWQAHHWYDQGGYLPTGWSTVFNGTGRPEPVLTDTQWRAMAENGAGGDGASLQERFDDLVEAVRNARPITVEDRSGNPVETARAAQLALRLAR